MRKLIVSEFISVDGIFEGPGPDDQFEYAGWTMPYSNESVMEFKLDELFKSDALLLGRITYEGFAKAWPGRTDEAGFANRMNNLLKYVVSNSLKETTWNNSHLITGNVAEAVEKLKKEEGQDILIAGSGKLVNFLTDQDLIDEYWLLVYPMLLRKGKRFFQEGNKVSLNLLESRSFSSGVVLMKYEVGRK